MQPVLTLHPFTNRRIAPKVYCGTGIILGKGLDHGEGGDHISDFVQSYDQKTQASTAPVFFGPPKAASEGMKQGYQQGPKQSTKGRDPKVQALVSQHPCKSEHKQPFLER